MEDRIKINGVWYIREDLSNKEEDIELYYSVDITYEDDKYVFVASRLSRNEELTSFYEYIDIKFTDKRVKPWKEEHWDNNVWMRGVLTNDSESMEDIRKSMCDNGIKTFRLFLNKLKERAWL
jgi:hypothetical protein